MKSLEFRAKLPIYAVLCIALISAVALIPLGYNPDMDIPSAVIAGQHWLQTGDYVASKSVGFPLFELMAGLTSRVGGSLLLNTTALVVASVGLLAQRSSFRKFGLSGPAALGATAFVASNPYVVVNAGLSSDHLFAVVALLIGLWLLSCRRYLLSGILFGLACGFRISSLAVLPGYVLLIWSNTDSNNQKKTWFVGQFISSLAVTVTIVYIPVVSTYGFSLLATLRDADYYYAGTFLRRAFGFVYKLAFQLFSLPVTIGLFVSALGGLRTAHPDLLRQRAFRITVDVAMLSAVAPLLIAYFLYPHRVEYLLPILPFVAFVVARHIDVRALGVLAGLMLLANFARIEVFDRFTSSIQVSLERGFYLEVRDQINIDRIAIPSLLAEDIPTRSVTLINLKALQPDGGLTRTEGPAVIEAQELYVLSTATLADKEIFFTTNLTRLIDVAPALVESGWQVFVCGRRMQADAERWFGIDFETIGIQPLLFETCRLQ